MDVVILGLSITSSWGNGHATTYRGLVRELERRGHDVTFLERDVPWYRDTRDLPEPPYGRTHLYPDLDSLYREHREDIIWADLVIIGSYVPDGARLARWVLDHARGMVAFYDIDTPVTLEALNAATADYLDAGLIPRFDLYLSFTGGPVLDRLEREFGARRARPLYCSVDPAQYYPEDAPADWDLGYLGTYASDRQPALDALLLEPARAWPAGRFAVAGSCYPDAIDWPDNVDRIDHLPPGRHRRFYNRQRFTLNVTRAAMHATGYAPSVRLFEAAACGTPIISDHWPGIDELFEPDREIVLADSAAEALACIHELPEERRRELGDSARRRVLAEHTAAHRAMELEDYVTECVGAAEAVAQ